MALLIAALVTSFIICFLTLPVIISYSLKKNLGDIPGRRKIHKNVTPSMGGVAIFLGFMISCMIWMGYDQWMQVTFVFMALSIMFFIGLRDDLVPLKPRVKLLGQVFAAGFLVFSEVRVHSFYGILQIGPFPDYVSYALTIFIVIIITNSFNLIDGLDGLAGTLASISFVAFGVWFFLIDDLTFSILCFSILGALFAFLRFNWEPSKIFMGDTGALTVGMLLGVMAIHFIHQNYYLAADNPYLFMGSVSTGVCFILVPLLDTLRIIILRLSKRKSPFKPDKSHVHHAILRLGLPHSKTTIVLGCIQILFIAVALSFHKMYDKYLIFGVVALATILSVTLDRLIIRKLKKG